MKTVFRTSDPAVLAAYNDAIAEHKKWGKEIEAFGREVHPDAKPMVGWAWGERRFDGLSVVDPVPHGWRVKSQKRGEDFMVPNKSLKAGKEWAKRMKELYSAPNVRGALPGMPTNVFSGSTLMHPGIDEKDGVLYAVWSNDPRNADTGFSKVEKLDESLWEQMKLSEWYAMQEEAGVVFAGA